MNVYRITAFGCRVMLLDGKPEATSGEHQYTVLATEVEEAIRIVKERIEEFNSVHEDKLGQVRGFLGLVKSCELLADNLML